MIRADFSWLVIASMLTTIEVNFTKLRAFVVDLIPPGEMGRYSVLSFAIWTVLSLIVTVFVYHQSKKKRTPIVLWVLAFLVPLASLYLMDLLTKWLGELFLLDRHLLFALLLGVLVVIIMSVIVRRNYMSSKFYFYRKRQSISTVMLLPYLWLYISIIFVQLAGVSTHVNAEQIFFFAMAALVALGVFAFGTDFRQI